MRVLITSIAAADWLCRALAEQEGLQIAAFHAAYVDLGDQGVARAGEPEGKPYLLRAARVFPVRPYPASLYLGGLAPLLRSFRPDLVYHFGEPSELGSWQVIRLVRRLCPEARIALFSLENVVREFRGFPRCLRAWAQRATIPRLDMVAAASQSVARAWERLGFDPDRIRVVYLPIDRERFYPRDARELRAQLGGPDQFVVGYIGRLVHEKAVDVLVRAAAQLPERFVLVIEGRGLCEADLHALAEGLKLGDRVRWLGRIPSQDVPLYMSAFDALVLPSRSIPVWQEQFGRVLPEAMSCETPVVGSSCGAIPDVIGDAGLVFPEEDASALAQCLVKLGADPALRADLIRRGVERVGQEFTFEVMTRRLVDLFRETLARTPGEPPCP